jgi:hypothetical protein
MMRKPSFAVIIASFYLVVYYILHSFEVDYRYVIWMFMGAPFILGRMAYTIIRHGKYDGSELQEHEEWGYSDKDRDSLGMF